MTPLKIAALSIASIVLLAACHNDAHKGQHCVKSHEETIWIHGACMVYTTIGKIQTCIAYQQIPITQTQCDTWVSDTPSITEDIKT